MSETTGRRERQIEKIRQQLKREKARLERAENEYENAVESLEFAKSSMTWHQNEVADLEDMLHLLLENNDG
jgi:exonuclease VII small subunit